MKIKVILYLAIMLFMQQVFLNIALSAQDILQTMQKESRTALVIGNGAYQHSPLYNSVKDAEKMATILRALGFEVILKTDLDFNEMHEVADIFGEKLRNRGGVGLFFYAGHGVQIGGKNYLLPVVFSKNGKDVRMSGKNITYRSLRADLLLSKMQEAGNRINIIILDACRSNPYISDTRSGQQQGLAPMDAPGESIIAYSTGPGKTADDVSIYTHELSRLMQKPGLRIVDLFYKVRKKVKKETNGRQIPWEHSSLTEPFFFRLEQPENASVLHNEKITEIGKTEIGKTAAVQVQTEEKEAVELQSPSISDISEPEAGKTWKEEITGMEFVWVPTGDYIMGCINGSCKNKNKTHVKGFWIGKYEVTVDQWQKFTNDNKKIKSKKRNRCKSTEFFQQGSYPANCISRDDAENYAKWISRKTGYFFRLPTQSEWEYAARSGGKKEIYAGTNDKESREKYANYGTKRPNPVASKRPNGLGIYDMSGNVWEWCSDNLGNNQYPLRGGSFRRYSAGIGECTTTFRMESAAKNTKDETYGFRLIRKMR